MPSLGSGVKTKGIDQPEGSNLQAGVRTFDQKDHPRKEEGEQGRTLAEILRSQEATAFLFNSQTLRKKALIALLEDLSPQDLEALYGQRPLTIELEDDLLEKIIELQNDNNQLKEMALVDGLTGLYNNRFFTTHLEKEMSRTRRTGLPCSLLVMDLDNFKILNDTLGHVEGNHFLVAVASLFRESLRSSDTICRFGGDEFTVIMPATILFEATRAADRLIEAVQEMAKPLGLGISLSAGVGEYTTASSFDLNEFVQATDAALYEAKRLGKNRLAVQEKAGPTLDERGMVGSEEKEALWNIKNYPQQKGEDDER